MDPINLKPTAAAELPAVHLEDGAGLARKWTVRAPVKSVRTKLRDLRQQIIDLNQANRQRGLQLLRDQTGDQTLELVQVPAELLDALTDMTEEEDARFMRLVADQINALTQNESGDELGDLLLEEWDADERTSDSIIAFRDDLLAAVGKPNAS